MRTFLFVTIGDISIHARQGSRLVPKPSDSVSRRAQTATMITGPALRWFAGRSGGRLLDGCPRDLAGVCCFLSAI